MSNFISNSSLCIHSKSQEKTIYLLIVLYNFSVVLRLSGNKVTEKSKSNTRMVTTKNPKHVQKAT